MLICVAVVLAVMGIKGSFVKSGKGLVIDLCDAFAVSGMLMLGVGLLIFVTNGGAFDMLAFGFIKLIDLFKKDLTKVKYRTFYDYHSAQSERKRPFLNIIIVGAVFTLVAVVFLIVYYNAF